MDQSGPCSARQTSAGEAQFRSGACSLATPSAPDDIAGPRSSYEPRLFHIVLLASTQWSSPHRFSAPYNADVGGVRPRRMPTEYTLWIFSVNLLGSTHHHISITIGAFTRRELFEVPATLGSTPTQPPHLVRSPGPGREARRQSASLLCGV